jgi:hypothetical protein
LPNAAARPSRPKPNAVALLSRHAGALGVAAIVSGVSSWLAVGFSSRIRDWGVMTDELLYVKLAISAATRHSPLPVVHGQIVGTINQLYPLLLAPFFGALDDPGAFRAAHILNAPLMASAAIPAYLLARRLVDKRAALAVALLSVVVVWMVLTGFLMTEVVAYPACLWALLGIERAMERASWRGDLLALAGIALAVLARTQLLFLVVLLPLAIVVHELGYGLVTASRTARVQALRSAGTAVLRRHRLLAALYGAAALGAIPLAVLGSLASVLGDYSVTATQGSLLPGGLWQSAAAHVDSVALGCGLLPLVLGGGWALTALVRPADRRAHAFATVAVLGVVLLALESASFDIRFGGGAVVRDRYLFYVVPLLFVGTAALLREQRRPWLAPAALTLFFAATVHWLELPAVTGLWVDSPSRVLNDLIAAQAGSLSPQAFVAWMGLLFGLCSVFAFRFAPRRVLAPTVFSVVLGLCVFTTVRAIDHTLGSASVSGRGMSAEPGVVLDWVDRVLPAGSSAAIVPFPTGPSFAADADLWWDTEFWNRTVTEAYVTAGDDFRYTPFPTRSLAPEWKTGRVPGTESAPPYVLMAEQDPRFGLAAGGRVGKNYGVEILETARPYRVAWMSRGLQPDGWTTPNRRATIRVFSTPHSATEVTVGLSAPASASARYAVRAAESTTHARISPGSSRTVRVSVCAGSAGHADIGLVSRSGARIAGVQQSFAAVPSRRVGVAVASISIRPLAGTCSA